MYDLSLTQTKGKLRQRTLPVRPTIVAAGQFIQGLRPATSCPPSLSISRIASFSKSLEQKKKKAVTTSFIIVQDAAAGVVIPVAIRGHEHFFVAPFDFVCVSS